MIPQIIGFAGKKKSGKDTALNVLRNLYPSEHFIRVAFADEVKKEVARACLVSVDYIELHKDKFRKLLQVWGTDYRRAFFGDDYWVDVWQKKVNYVLSVNPGLHIVVPDVRFLNEAKRIREVGGKLYLIRAVGNPVGEDIDTHQSEMELEKITPDFTLINDFKDIAVLRKEIQNKMI